MSSSDSMTREQVLDRFSQSVQPCTVSLGGGAVADYDPTTGRVTIEFESTAAHCHSGHVVQGGFVAGMLDSAMSMAVMAQSGFSRAPATLELKVSYLKGTTLGRNTAVGWAVQTGKTVAFVEGELYNANGELLAKASSSARLVPAVT